MIDQSVRVNLLYLGSRAFALAGKSQGNLRHIRHKSKHAEAGENHRHDCSGNGTNGHAVEDFCLCPRGSCCIFDFQSHGNKKVYSDRRRNLSDCKVYSRQYTEGDQAVSQRLGYGSHDGNKDVHGGVCVDKAACDQENNVDNQQEYDPAASYTGKQGFRRLGNTKQCAAVRKERGRRNDQHDSSGCFGGINKDARQILPGNFFINNHTHKETVNDRNSSCLCGSKDPSVNASQNNNGHQDSPKRIPECRQTFFAGSFFMGRLNMFSACLNHYHNNQSRPHKNTGDNSSHEHFSDICTYD